MQLGGVLLYLKKFEVTRCVINESPLFRHDESFLEFIGSFYAILGVEKKSAVCPITRAL